MDGEIKTKKIEFKNHYEIRGYFIDCFSHLETMMEMYLTRYFFKGGHPKSFELRTILIDRLTFEAKKTALKFILDSKSERDFKAGKHGNNKKNYKKLLEDIGKLGKIRNYFAHYQVMFPSPDGGNLIRLVEGRDQFKVIEYTTKQFEAHINTLNRCYSELRNMPFDD